MISPDEIKQQALRWWKPFVVSFLDNEDFFPKLIERVGRVKPSDITGRFGVLQKEIELLHQHSKEQTGKGYRVITEAKNFRRTGVHELPAAIKFETAEDFLSLTGKKKEWQLFLSAYQKLILGIPELKSWMRGNVFWLTRPSVEWGDVLKICNYFLENPRPHLYIRQLPIEVHTKFIEDNDALLQSLLDFLIPEHVRDPAQRRFAERYFLRYDEPLVRLRFLDENLSCGGFSDVSLPLSDFEYMSLTAENIIITENKMNFLTLPQLKSTVAIWSGGGFQVSFLKGVTWLHKKRLFYWGDMDEHGFQILHQLRSYFPEVKSVMMAKSTFDQFESFAVAGARNISENLNLNAEEKELFLYLKTRDKNRLEQEKIPQDYADYQLNHFLITTNKTR